MKQVLRTERKFMLSLADFERKYYELKKLLHEDPHNGLNGYIVRSLYFDTMYDDDYFDKMYGFNVRKKMRLRIYDTRSEYVTLEMKQKQGYSQKKRSLKVRSGDAKRLIQADYSPLLAYSEPFAAECYALMTTRVYRPKAVVEYHRRAFISENGNVRITFDQGIRANEANYDIFDEKLILNPVMAEDFGVLEVKYTGYLLNYFQELLNDLDRNEISASKYCMARQQSYHDHL